MKTFKILNFNINIKLDNNKIIVELFDLISNNIFKKEFDREQIIVDVTNPLYIKDNDSKNTNIINNLNINEIYNLCKDDNKRENLKEYEYIEDTDEYFFSNIENKNNRLSIIKNEKSIKVIFNCEINTITQINIIFNFDNVETNTSYDKNKINQIENKINKMESKIIQMENKINQMENKINQIEDKINIITKYDINLIPNITLNTIIFTLIITGCISNVVKIIYRK
jgi:hypothetical protein